MKIRKKSLDYMIKNIWDMNLYPKKIMISTKVVERIIRKFHMHGEEALKKKAKRKFSANFKLEVIKRVLSGEAKSSVSIEYNIEPAQIRLWIKNYEEKGYNGLNNKPKGRPSIMKKEKKRIDPNDKDAIIKQKDERILELEAEVEALKKLRALVLQRNEQQIKKKQ